MYDFDYICNNVSLTNGLDYPIEFEPSHICDYFPSQFIEHNWYNLLNLLHPNIETLSSILYIRNKNIIN